MRHDKRIALKLIELERRENPATLIVQSTGDAGFGTLRDAIQQANSTTAEDEILIDVFGTIQLNSVLPQLTSSVKILGSGADKLSIRPTNSFAFRGFSVATGVTASFSDLTIEEFGARQGGGDAGVGGGLLNLGNVTIKNVVFEHNSSETAGGGIYSVGQGTLSISNSSFHLNVAPTGAGIYATAINLSNSTVSTNFATENGAGVYITAQGSALGARISNSTITNNVSFYTSTGGTQPAGGGLFSTNLQVGPILENTVVAGNFRGQAATVPDDVRGRLDGMSGFNVVGNGDALFGAADGNRGNRFGTEASPIDAKLGFYMLNGGSTPTHAPMPGSPLIDGADRNVTDMTAKDQRGFNRVVNNILDVGSFEYQPPDVSLRLMQAAIPGKGSEITFLVFLDTAPGSNPASGTVTFFLDDMKIGEDIVQLDRAALTTNDLPLGKIRIEYSGNEVFNKATLTNDYSAPGVVTPIVGQGPGMNDPANPMMPGDSKNPMTPANPAMVPVNKMNAPAKIAALPQGFAVGAGDGGTVRVLNQNGSDKFSVAPFGGGFTAGVRVAMGDVNGDGVADLVVGTGPGVSTIVKVFDGKTQQELFSLQPFEGAFTGGVYVAVGDTNGDGFADIAITPDEGGGPRVRLFSGNGFGQLADFFGIDDTSFRGGARPSFGDLNGDGRSDLLLAAGFGGGPRLAGFAGESLGNSPRKLFNDFFIFEQALRNGAFVAAGDVNGDGFADVVAGAGPGGGPRVFALNGKDVLNNNMNPLVNFFAGDTNSRGGARVSVANLDGDNRADIVVGAGTQAGSRVSTYLGSNLGASSSSFDAFGGSLGGVFVG